MTKIIRHIFFIKLFKIIYYYRTVNRKPKYHISEHNGSSSYFRRGNHSTNRTPQYSPSSSNNMEFLRGVYAFMQVSRSSVSIGF